MKKFAPIIVFVLAVIGVAVVAWPRGPEEGTPHGVTPSVTDTPTPVVPQQSSTPTVSWNTYQSKDVGIAFDYPDGQNSPGFRIQNGDSGRGFMGSFSLPSGALVQFVATTPDYSVGKGAIIPATEGYAQTEDGYRAYRAGKPSGMLLSPSEIWTLRSGGEALVFFGERFDRTLDYPDPAIWAAVNLPGTEFPGIGFKLVYPGEAPRTASPEDVETFKRVIESITFTSS